MVDSVKRGAVTAAALVLSAAGGNAEAAQIISVPLSSVLSNGGSYAGIFDISSFLNQGGNQYQLVSASVELQGYSPYSATYSYITGYYSYLAGYYIAGYYGYSCGWTSTCYAPYYAPYYAYAANYANADGFQDSLRVDVGNGTGTGWDANQGGGAPTNYYGSIISLANLTGADLNVANGSGLVNYLATAQTNSNIQLSSAKLTFDLQRVDSAVPEPKTWAMMLVGFGLVGGELRRRHPRKKMAPA